eukprot:768724-Hanusia_phi.AAC.4
MGRVPEHSCTLRDTVTVSLSQPGHGNGPGLLAVSDSESSTNFRSSEPVTVEPCRRDIPGFRSACYLVPGMKV